MANHYFMDASTLGHADSDFVGHLERTERVLGMTGPRKLFRPPGGLAWPRQLRLAQSRGYVCVLGSAYPHDPVRPPVWYIRWLTTKNLAPGAIVILHDGIADATRSIAALPDILATGRRKGLRFVSVGTLIDATGTTSADRDPDPRPDAPLLIVDGRHDFVVPYRLWEGVADRLPGATLEIFSRSGHHPFFEEPERFTEVVTRWMGVR